MSDSEVGIRQLVHIDALGPQVSLGHLDLVHQLGIGLGCVAEGEQAEAQTEEEPGAKGYEGPKGKLLFFLTVSFSSGGCWARVSGLDWTGLDRQTG